MVGLVPNQGDRAIQADIARLLFGLDGSGIKIGVISDSFDFASLATDGERTAAKDVINGELPGANNPNGYTKPVHILADSIGNDSGRALLQVIHDVAPSAELFFHTVSEIIPGKFDDFNNQGFVNAVEALTAAGVDIILADPDAGFPMDMPFFQDGIAAQAIDKAVQNGITVIAPARNIGNQSYESVFRASETFTIRGTTYEAHDFDPGNGTDVFQDIQFGPLDIMRLYLNWQQPSGQVASEYQMFLMDTPQLPGQGGQILNSSILPIDGTDDPSAFFGFANPTEEPRTAYLVIAKQANTSSQSTTTTEPEIIKWINGGDGSINDKTIFEYVNDSPNAAGAGTVYGSANAEGAITVGAADFAQTPAFGVTPVQVQDLSSRGSSPIFFDAQGHPLETPERRQKPDLIGPTATADRSNFLSGLEWTFDATPAAAAHTVGAVALMLQRAGGSGSLTPEQIRTVLQETDSPVAPQPNLPQGTGFLQANDAVVQSFQTQRLGTPRNDVIRGQQQADNLYGLAGNDKIVGGRGFDALWGGNGNDLLKGDDGNDYLVGEQGNDTLRGGNGDDFLRGDRGTNELTGGKGADKFLLDAEGKAIIRDFRQGEDTLVLAAGVEFSDLQFKQRRNNTVIQLKDYEIAVLLNVASTAVTAADVLPLPGIRQVELPIPKQPEPDEEIPSPIEPEPEPEMGNGSVQPVISAGDRAMRSDVARQLFRLDGSGIKIGVISDSFASFGSATQDVKTGELPGTENPLGRTKPVKVLQDLPEFFGSDEGRAMLQIIHDVAPGAELLFHTVVDDSLNVSPESIATAMRALADAGADIIVDDVGIFNTPYFQDGISAQTVDQLTQQGVIYVSAAGNDGNDRSYEGAFNVGQTFSYRGVTYDAHDFDTSNRIDVFQDIQLSSENGRIALDFQWQQVFGQAKSDFELFLMDSPQLPGAGGKILAVSRFITPTSVNDPTLFLEYGASLLEGNSETVYLLAAKRQTAANADPGRIKWIDLSRQDNTYEYVNDSPTAIPAGTVYGHSNAAGAIAVGAADFAQTPEFGVTPAQVEDFSSSGATPILIDAQNNPLKTPELREKPDIIGPNRGATTVLPIFETFAGTSAAAPHVAAAIALMLQRAGGSGSLTSEQVRTILRETDSPVTPQPNLPQDSGFIQADHAVIHSFTTQQIGTDSDDILRGSQQSENLYGLAGNDTIRGGKGFDALFGGAGNDALKGDRGNDYLLGEGDDDTLVGGKGDDFLAGGQGQNRLLGGQGTDIFLLDLQGVARIQDFQSGQDQMNLPAQLQFSDLKIMQQGRNTLISSSNSVLAELMGIKATAVKIGDFVLSPLIG